MVELEHVGEVNQFLIIPSLKDMTLEEAWNSDYYKNLRFDMLNGVKK